MIKYNETYIGGLFQGTKDDFKKFEQCVDVQFYKESEDKGYWSMIIYVQGEQTLDEIISRTNEVSFSPDFTAATIREILTIIINVDDYYDSFIDLLPMVAKYAYYDYYEMDETLQDFGEG